MTIEIHDDRFTSIVDQTVSLNVVGSNFDFIEGPIWNHIDNHLIFSDMPGNKMRKWTSENGIEIFREPSNMANGNAYDNQGRLVTCEHATINPKEINYLINHIFDLGFFYRILMIIVPCKP